MVQQSPAVTGKNTSLKDLVEELGTASDEARLQLHLLALETRQRAGELGTRLEKLEHELDRGLHQAFSTATERARQWTKLMHASLGRPPASKSPKRSGQLRIRAIMSEPVQSCSIDDTLQRPAQLMWDNDCGCVPAVDAEGRLRGIITDRDICMATHTRGLAPQHVHVSEVMSQPVHTCSPDDTLERAIAIMAEGQVRRLPIVSEDQRVLGMVSLADIALHGALLGRREAEGLTFRLLGALSKRRRVSNPPFGE
jgi:CBS domain-containing protein